MKNLQTQYTFVAASKTIQCDDFLRFGLPRILLIVNVTRGVVVYNPSNTATTGTLSDSTLTLTFDTTSHSNTDMLQVFTDDGDTGATEQTLSQLVQIMQDLAERLDVYPDGQGALRTSVTNQLTIATGNLGNLNSVGQSAQNLDNLWRHLMQAPVELQNQLFPVT